MSFKTNICILKKIVLSYFLQSQLDATIVLVFPLFECNGYVIHFEMYLQIRNDSSTRDVFSEKSLAQF